MNTKRMLFRLLQALCLVAIVLTAALQTTEASAKGGKKDPCKDPQYGAQHMAECGFESKPQNLKVTIKECKFELLVDPKARTFVWDTAGNLVVDDERRMVKGDVFQWSGENLGDNFTYEINVVAPGAKWGFYDKQTVENECWEREIKIVSPDGTVTVIRDRRSTQFWQQRRARLLAEAELHSRDWCVPVEQIATTDFNSGKLQVVNYDTDRENWKAVNAKHATQDQSGESFHPSNNPVTNCEQVYVNIRPDGRRTLWQQSYWGQHRVQMVHEDGTPVLGVTPNWGPKGRIVYSSFEDDSYFLHTINEDGTDDVNLKVAGFYPEYSEDGSLIAYVTHGDGFLAFVNADGTNPEVTDIRMSALKWLSDQLKVCGDTANGIMCYDLKEKTATLADWAYRFATDPTDSENGLLVSKRMSSMYFGLDIKDKPEDVVFAGVSQVTTVDWTAPDREDFKAINLRIKRQVALNHSFLGDVSIANSSIEEESTVTVVEVAPIEAEPQVASDQPLTKLFSAQLGQWEMKHLLWVVLPLALVIIAALLLRSKRAENK